MQSPETGNSVDLEVHPDAIRAQLNRLVASPLFSGSKRHTSFLRHIVEQTLENGGTELRERIIGVQAFGRREGYDTSADPVVRVSAGDLRKRLARYYYEHGHESELRIELPTGSYRPLFIMPPVSPTTQERPVEPDPQASTATAAEPDLPDERIVPFPRLRSIPLPFVVAGIVIATGIAVWGSIKAVKATRTPGTAFEQFWKPVVAGKGAVVIYAGSRDDGDLSYEDAIAIADLSADLQALRKPYRIMKASQLNTATMREGPSLLIGGLTNPISRRVTQQLRFTFATQGDPARGGKAYIQDRQNPDGKDWWTATGPLAESQNLTDYAIVSRVVDPVTDRIAVVAAGIRRYGNVAAAEFLSKPDQMEQLAGKAPADWRTKNMQAVLAVTVRNGSVQESRVVASDFW